MSFLGGEKIQQEGIWGRKRQVPGAERKELEPAWSVMEKWQLLINQSLLAQGEGLAIILPEGFKKEWPDLIYIFRKSFLVTA